MHTIVYPSFPRAERQRIGRTNVACVVAGTAVTLVGFLFVGPWSVAGGFPFFALAAKRGRRWQNMKTGERGEDRVARALKRLDDSYTLVRNWVPPGCQSDVDLVLLGPHGALVIEVKTYTVPTRCDGDAWRVRGARGRWKTIPSPAVQLRRNVERTERALGVPVEGVIVFNDRAPLKVRHCPETVLRRAKLRRFVRRLPRYDGEDDLVARLAA